MAHHDFLCALRCSLIDGKDLVDDTEKSIECGLNRVSTVDRYIAMKNLLKHFGTGDQALTFADELFNGKGVTDDPAWETYWKAKNGIRLTGMPAFKETLNDTQIWQVSVLLANADKISPAVKAALATTPAAQSSPLPVAAPPKK